MRGAVIGPLEEIKDGDFKIFQSVYLRRPSTAPGNSLISVERDATLMCLLSRCVSCFTSARYAIVRGRVT